MTMTRARDVALLTPQRRQILAYLGQERMAGEIARQFPAVHRTSVSQHLTVLVAAELVTVRRDGRRRWYRADRFALRAMILEAWEELVP